MQPEPEESCNLIPTLVAEPRGYGLPPLTERRSDEEILSVQPVNQEAKV